MTSAGAPTLFVFGDGAAVFPAIEVHDRTFEPGKNWR
jgi:hypothetical protein